MDVQPLVLTFFRFLLGTIFLSSFVGKASEPRRFATTLVDFKLIPGASAQPLAYFLISSELVIGILLLMGWQTRAAAVLCGGVLIIFTVAVALNLMSGHTNLECGCFGAKNAQKINLQLVSRNVSLTIVAFCIAIWGGGLMTLDDYPLVLQKLLMAEMLLPFMLVCVGASILVMLVQKLYRLLRWMTLEQ